MRHVTGKAWEKETKEFEEGANEDEIRAAKLLYADACLELGEYGDAVRTAFDCKDCRRVIEGAKKFLRAGMRKDAIRSFRLAAMLGARPDETLLSDEPALPSVPAGGGEEHADDGTSATNN
ncbi:MAG: hypothetical protein WA208_19260 [Thermoanaerobaculia bacterium]